MFWHFNSTSFRITNTENKNIDKTWTPSSAFGIHVTKSHNCMSPFSNYLGSSIGVNSLQHTSTNYILSFITTSTKVKLFPPSSLSPTFHAGASSRSYCIWPRDLTSYICSGNIEPDNISFGRGESFLNIFWFFIFYFMHFMGGIDAAKILQHCDWCRLSSFFQKYQQRQMSVQYSIQLKYIFNHKQSSSFPDNNAFS